MARKKDPAKPLLSLKHDFYDSVNNTIQEAIMLLQAVDFVLKYGGDRLPPEGKKELETRAAAFRAAVFNED